MKLAKGLTKHIINEILLYKKPEKVMIFGSRATGHAQETSDIDIAVFGKNWTDRDINLVRHRLDENVKTALKFDVLHFYRLKKASLKKNILREGHVIYEA